MLSERNSSIIPTWKHHTMKKVPHIQPVTWRELSCGALGLRSVDRDINHFFSLI